MDLLSLLMGSMTQNSSVNAVSQNTGVSGDLVKKLLVMALPLILKSLTQNASSANGASSLLGALTQHSSKKSIAEQLSAADADDGGKIIGHIFGDKKDDVIIQLADQAGMKQSDVSSILSNVAPAVLSSLSATTQAGTAAQNSGAAFDMGSLLGGSDLLSGIFGGAQAAQAAPQGGGGLLSALSSLLGGGQQDPGPQAAGADDAAINGGDLLSALLGLK